MRLGKQIGLLLADDAVQQDYSALDYYSGSVDPIKLALDFPDYEQPAYDPGYTAAPVLPVADSGTSPIMQTVTVAPSVEQPVLIPDVTITENTGIVPPGESNNSGLWLLVGIGIVIFLVSRRKKRQ